MWNCRGTTWNVAKDISRDGQFVLFEDASEAAGPGYAVALRKLDGTLPVRLGDGSAGGLSPDGKWAISVSTGQPQQVTLLPIGAGQPRSVDIGGLEHIQTGWARFLADGQRLCITNGNEQGRSTRCYLLDLAGAKPKALTPEGSVCGPSSPDNRFRGWCRTEFCSRHLPDRRRLIASDPWTGSGLSASAVVE